MNAADKNRLAPTDQAFLFTARNPRADLPGAGPSAAITVSRHHRIDARHWRRLVAIAEAETNAVLAGLPPALRRRVEDLPVVFEPWASDELVATGLDPDILGLFVGDPHHLGDSPEPMPPQIFLFLESLWDFAGGDEATYREEVHNTYLHELGHYLGLDETDLEERGLD